MSRMPCHSIHQRLGAEAGEQTAEQRIGESVTPGEKLTGYEMMPEVIGTEELIPASYVESGDLIALCGEGIDPAINGEIDAVEEILGVHPDDTGLRQMAAKESGKTEAAAIAPEIFAGKDVAEKDVPAVEAETVEEGSAAS